MKLKLVAPKPTGNGAELYLNGMRLGGVVRVEVDVCAGDVNRATITLLPSEIEIKGEFGTIETKQDLAISKGIG